MATTAGSSLRDWSVGGAVQQLAAGAGEVRAGRPAELSEESADAGIRRGGADHSCHDMATSEKYGHLPISRLALLAQRLGKVYASAATWAKLNREGRWRRPRQRVYPARAKVGVRATKLNEYFYMAC